MDIQYKARSLRRNFFNTRMDQIRLFNADLFAFLSCFSVWLGTGSAMAVVCQELHPQNSVMDGPSWFVGCKKIGGMEHA